MTDPSAMLAGFGITAAMIRGVAPLSVVKPGNETRTSTTTITSDEDLFVPVPANSSWIWVSMVGYNGADFTTGGMQGGLWEAWNLPANAAGSWMSLGYGTGTTLIFSQEWNNLGKGQNAHNTHSTTFTLPLLYFGQVTIGNTAGNIQYAWAQGNSNATATTVVAGSWMAAWQVG